MGLYNELVSNPGKFTQRSLEEKPKNALWLGDDVDAIVLKMGEFKFRYVASLIATVIPEERISRLDAETKETNRWPGRPDIVAAEKIERDCLSRDLPQPDKLALLLGQDVQLCDEDGMPIYKPESALSKEEILTEMVKVLCVEENITFRLKSGIAAFGRNGFREELGATLYSEHRFTVAPLRREELMTYVEEMSLEELKQTNGGFRWPHDIFISHIRSIDEVEIRQPDYSQKQEELFMNLIGAMPESLLFLKMTVDRMKRKEAGERWQRLIVLRNGEIAEIRPINLANNEEILQVSTLVRDNFTYHSYYNNLTPEARQRYINANDLEGIRQTCANGENIFAIVVIKDKQIIGYCVTRKEGKTIEVRRLHTRLDSDDLGIGTFFIEEAIAAARYNKCSEVAVIASGDSGTFFRKRGFGGNGKAVNNKLSQEGINVVVDYCTRKI